MTRSILLAALLAVALTACSKKEETSTTEVIPAPAAESAPMPAPEAAPATPAAPDAAPMPAPEEKK